MKYNRTTCPDCELEGKYKPNVGVYEDGLYCFRCEKMTKFEDNEQSSNLPLLEGKDVPGLPKRNISEATTKAFNVTYSGNKLIFPYYKEGKLVAQKTKTKDKEYSWINYSSGLDMFGSKLHDSSRNNIIITEGEEDAMAVYQALGTGSIRSLNHVTSLPKGAGNAVKFIDDNYMKLSQYNTVTLAFDEDEAGQNAKNKVIPLFSKNKLRIVKLPRKDACDMLINNQQEELKWAILKAESIIPKGIVRVAELSDDFFDYEPEPGIDLAFPKLTYALAGLRKGELTMVTGGTGLGKSVFTTNLIYDMVVNKGLSVCDIKLEEDKKKTIFTYAGMYFNDRKYAHNPKSLTPEQRHEFKDKFSRYLTYDHFGSLDSRELLSVLEYYALSEKVDFIFLDHISMAISGMTSSKEGERKDIDILTTKIRELINTSEVGFVCVSHLSNPGSGSEQWESGRKVNRSALRGSGSLGQLSDNIIGIEGDLLTEEVKEERQIRLLKTRYGRCQETLCDKFSYDITTGKVNLINEVF